MHRSCIVVFLTRPAEIGKKATSQLVNSYSHLLERERESTLTQLFPQEAAISVCRCASADARFWQCQLAVIGGWSVGEKEASEGKRRKSNRHASSLDSHSPCLKELVLRLKDPPDHVCCHHIRRERSYMQRIFGVNNFIISLSWLCMHADPPGSTVVYHTYRTLIDRVGAILVVYLSLTHTHTYTRKWG
jgi:hypothetical protein